MGGLNKGVARQAHMGQRNGGRGTALRGMVGAERGVGAPGERQRQVSGVRLVEDQVGHQV